MEPGIQWHDFLIQQLLTWVFGCSFGSAAVVAKQRFLPGRLFIRAGVPGP